METQYSKEVRFAIANNQGEIACHSQAGTSF
jgi:hypothetical protein